MGQSAVDVLLVCRVAACPYSWGLSLLRINVVNRAESDIQVRLMAICSFYYKTNVVIPTCISDEFPPVLPSSG